MGTEKKTTKAVAKPARAPRVVSPKVAADEIASVHRRLTMVGTVVSNKMMKTIVVRVDRKVRHGEYQKFVSRSKKYKAHDEKNTAKPGDLVTIIQTRPYSKEKCWALHTIVRKASATAQVTI